LSHETTALAVVDPTTAALASFGIADGEPTKPTNILLIQKADEDNPSLIPGKFMDTQSNLVFNDIELVPINMGTGRTLFPDDTLGAKPLCRSNDGILPVISDDYIRQDGGLGCAKCPKSQWVRKGGKLIKPECQENLKFLFAELSTGFVYRFNAKGMGLAPVKDLKETIKKLVVRTKLPPYALTFKLTSTKIKGQKGTYYIPKFAPTGQVNPADIPTFQNIWAFFEKPANNGEDAAPAASNPVSTVLEGEYEAA
jgi:hypothetical protein